MKINFIIDYKEKKFASGKLFFLSGENILHETNAYSGSKFATEKNKGALQEGSYKVVSFRLTNETPFTYDGFGWIAGIIPEFKTDRFDLAIHPDGGIEGSAGCIVNRWNKEESLKIFNLIRDGLEQGTMFLNVIFSGRQK